MSNFHTSFQNIQSSTQSESVDFTNKEGQVKEIRRSTRRPFKGSLSKASPALPFLFKKKIESF